MEMRVVVRFPIGYPTRRGVIDVKFEIRSCRPDASHDETTQNKTAKEVGARVDHNTEHDHHSSPSPLFVNTSFSSHTKIITITQHGKKGGLTPRPHILNPCTAPSRKGRNRRKPRGWEKGYVHTYIRAQERDGMMCDSE